jgi:hypothetical protein
MSHDPNDHKSTIAVDQNFFRKVAEAEPSPGRILKIELLAKSIETSLQMQSGSLTSADLALQLIKTTQKFVFQSSGIKA